MLPPEAFAPPAFDPLDDAEVAALGAGGYVLRDGVLGEPLARAAAREAQTLCETHPLRTPGLGRQAVQVHALRNDAITWLDEAHSGPALVALRRLFEQVGETANQGAYLGVGRFDLQLARFDAKSARYTRHRDAFAGHAGPNRRLTAIWYANPDWTTEHGGVLRVYPEGADPVDLAPVLDRLVMFLSDRLEHEVLPAHAPRVALTAWFYPRGA